MIEREQRFGGMNGNGEKLFSSKTSFSPIVLILLILSKYL